jgi:microcystin synthetase protein McyA
LWRRPTQLDTIVCNGVSMYFPSATYLLQCIQNALAALQPGGRLYLGDVRCNSLLHHFHAACQLAQAPHGMRPL